MSELRTSIWESLLDAEMNVKYWGYLAERFVKKERALKITLSLTTASGLLSLSVWNSFPAGPVALGVLNTILACSLPILNYSERIEAMSSLRGSWTQLCIEFQRVWQQIGSPNSSCENEFRLLKERIVHLSVIETRLPNDRKLVQRCQQEIIRSHGLIPEREKRDAR
jgi:hypothetical protein